MSVDVLRSLNRGIGSSLCGDGYIVSDRSLGYDNAGEFGVSIIAITDSQFKEKSISRISV